MTQKIIPKNSFLIPYEKLFILSLVVPNSNGDTHILDKQVYVEESKYFLLSFSKNISSLFQTNNCCMSIIHEDYNVS